MGGSYVISGRVAEAGLSELHGLIARVGSEHPELASIDLLMLETALLEVAGNVVEHGTPLGGIRYRFALEVSSDGLHGAFTDDGDAVVLPEERAAPADPLAESGRGLALARAALTELRYERQSDGNAWFLTRLTDGSIPSPRCSG